MTQSIGIIGCGTVTTRMYVPTLARLKQVRLKYVYDVASKNAEAVSMATGAHIQSPDFIFANSDYAVIATPPSSHYELVRLGIEHKCRTIVGENPFWAAAEQARALPALAHSVGVNLYVGKERFFADDVP